MRETLFNWLGQDLSGLSCLDLFAGSGILGFEAASRGAAQVTLVENDRKVFSQLQQNAAALKFPHIELVCGDALKFAPTRRFDLILLDPPYHQGWLEKVAPLLDDWAAPGARIYAEAEHALEGLGAWKGVKRGRAGQVFFQLLEK